MNKPAPILQIVIYVVCGIGILFAVLIFSGKIPIGGGTSTTTISGTVTMWGTLPANPINLMVQQVRTTYKNVSVVYVQKDPATIQSDLVNALASGTGPDLVLMTPDEIIPNHDRIFEIPYASFPQATFDSAFASEGSVFLSGTGVLGFPLFIDPMVMYYNKDMLTSSFTVKPPKTWDDVVALNQKITQKDNAGKLSTETVALGTYDNITNAKDLMASLIFQAGNDIVSWDPVYKKYVSRFGDTDQAGNSAVSNALTFYTAFANPTDGTHYSWNATLANDRDQFVSGNLAVYFGFASELSTIRQLNPNLNFDVSLMPQRASTQTKSTYGNMIGVSIMKLSPNTSLDVLVAEALAGQPAIAAYQSFDSTLQPARLDMLSNTSSDAHATLFANSAIIAKTFLDPDPIQTGNLFKNYVTSVNAGASDPGSLISTGNSKMQSILDVIARQTSAAQAQSATQ